MCWFPSCSVCNFTFYCTHIHGLFPHVSWLCWSFCMHLPIWMPSGILLPLPTPCSNITAWAFLKLLSPPPPPLSAFFSQHPKDSNLHCVAPVFLFFNLCICDPSEFVFIGKSGYGSVGGVWAKYTRHISTCSFNWKPYGESCEWSCVVLWPGQPSTCRADNPRGPTLMLLVL